MTTGLVVGKFYPPHRGHKHLIDAAKRQVDQLIVMICDHRDQTIRGDQRRSWLAEIHPDCDIRVVPDTLDDDSQQWAAFTLDYLGFAPDLVFSSEDYGPCFASLMGSRHVMVDRFRQSVPISATAVRASPLDHLDFLEPCVRAFFIRRVVLIGAESTGKTTLGQLLAERLRTNWVPEYGREFAAAKIGVLPIEGPLPPWHTSEFLSIAQEQQRRENAAARHANRVLVCDTNAFATGTWHERYLGCRSKEVDAIGRGDVAHLYLLTDPDFDFVQDGTRDGRSIRSWMHNRLLALLPQTGVPFVRLRGPVDRRLADAQFAIDALVNQPFNL